MEHAQPRGSSRPPSRLSTLKQLPITPVMATFPQVSTQTIFLDHPSARLSSSPASSPRIIEPSPVRRGSVHPAMSDTMEKGIHPGGDFFDDDSSESEWEDSIGDVTQTFSEANGHGLKSLVHGMHSPESQTDRGRSRERHVITALPLYDQHSTDKERPSIGDHSTTKPLPSPLNERETKTAREMSLRRLNRQNVRVVHNRSNGGTPRDSIRSGTSDDGMAIADGARPFLDARSTSAGPPPNGLIKGRHRRNTSDSVIAGSIINAHVLTMRALESLSHTQSEQHTNSDKGNFPKPSSFTASRQITMSPLRTSAELDRQRPAHLPDHFVRTPYPFSTKKEFPKPVSRPRQLSEKRVAGSEVPWTRERLDSGYSGGVGDEFDDTKGKHVLGLTASNSEYDLRSRIQMNEEAQGAIRSQSHSSIDGAESTVWVSLHRESWRGRDLCQNSKKLAKVVISSNLTTSPESDGKQSISGRNKDVAIDFDDQVLAQRLRASHDQLAGSWMRRAFSARKLQTIRLANVGTWSGNSASTSLQHTPRLLAEGKGIELDADSRSPFTEESLMQLYKHPASGKARYTWIHWARRVAQSKAQSANTRLSALASPIQLTAGGVPDSITTVQFVHTLSALRIVVVLGFIMMTSLAAAVLWVCVGVDSTGWMAPEYIERSNRVGGGMAIGILVLLLESLGFGAWLLLS